MGHQHNLDENQNDDDKQLAPSVRNKQQVMPMITANTTDIEKQAIEDVPAIPLKPGNSPPPVKFQEEDPFRPGTYSDQMGESIGIAICLFGVVAIALLLYISKDDWYYDHEINYINNSTNATNDYE